METFKDTFLDNNDASILRLVNLNLSKNVLGDSRIPKRSGKHSNQRRHAFFFTLINTLQRKESLLCSKDNN